MANEHGLATPLHRDRLARLNVGQVNLQVCHGQHVLGGGHGQQELEHRQPHLSEETQNTSMAHTSCGASAAAQQPLTAAAPMKRPPVSTKYVNARLEGSPTGKGEWLEVS